MKEKIKKVLKNRLFLFALGILISGSVSVLAVTYFPSNQVTYNNGTSGLKSTDVQGAIDELYNTCSNVGNFSVNVLGKKMEINISCDGSGGQYLLCSNGLYQDYEDKNRYVFRGKNPNNYITFNGEKAGWRIISKEADGTVKIIRNTSIGNMQWHNDCPSDYDICHNWTAPASLNTYLNVTYYNSLTLEAKNQIESKDWSVLITSNWGQSNSTVIWPGKIALPTLMDLFYSTASLNYCSSIDYFRSYNCYSNSWMVNNFNWWFLDVPFGRVNYPDNSYVYLYNNTLSGVTNIARGSVTESYGVRPTFYLSSNVKITGGTGTKSDPYVIE